MKISLTVGTLDIEFPVVVREGDKLLDILKISLDLQHILGHLSNKIVRNLLKSEKLMCYVKHLR